MEILEPRHIQSEGKRGLLRSIGRIVAGVLVALVALPIIIFACFRVYQYYQDRIITTQARDVGAYLESYFAEHHEYPSFDEFHTKYSSRFRYTLYPEDKPQIYHLGYDLARKRSFEVGHCGAYDWFEYGCGFDSCNTGKRCRRGLFSPTEAPDGYTLVPGVGSVQPGVANGQPAQIALYYRRDEHSNYLEFPQNYFYSQLSAGHIRFRSDIQFDPAYFTEGEKTTRDNPAMLLPGATPNTYHSLVLHLTGKRGTTELTYAVDCGTATKNCDPTVTLVVEIY